MKHQLFVFGTASRLTSGIRNFPPFLDNAHVKNIQFWDGAGQF